LCVVTTPASPIDIADKNGALLIETVVLSEHEVVSADVADTRVERAAIIALPARA
jgi:hypothetical protein